MVTHLSYSEERYRDSRTCLAGIRSYLERGWELSQLRGPADGPFFVLFRIQQEAHS